MRWSAAETELLKSVYPHKPNRDIIKLFPYHTEVAMKTKARKIGLTKTPEALLLCKKPKNSPWTNEKTRSLIKLYPCNTANYIAAKLKISRSAVKNKIHKLGLNKEENTGCYEKGNIPANKGKRQVDYMTYEAIEKTKATRFKKGNIPTNHRPVGSIRISIDHYYYIKISEPRTWELLHRVIWEYNNPSGMLKTTDIITFKDGNTANISYSNLEKITREESMERTRNTDEFIACLIMRDKEKRKEILKHPELIELKRKLINLKRTQYEKA